MTTSGPFLVGAVITALFTSIQAPPKQAAPDSFTLTRDVPNDVFLCVAARHNPRHEFLDR